jgi:hypothetical protein
MRVYNWSAPTDFATVCRRAKARCHYNAVRKFRAMHRRVRLLEILEQYPRGVEPYQQELAERLGVSQATISRDLRILRPRRPPSWLIPLAPWPVAEPARAPEPIVPVPEPIVPVPEPEPFVPAAEAFLQSVWEEAGFPGRIGDR